MTHAEIFPQLEVMLYVNWQALDPPDDIIRDLYFKSVENILWVSL